MTWQINKNGERWGWTTHNNLPHLDILALTIAGDCLNPYKKFVLSRELIKKNKLLHAAYVILFDEYEERYSDLNSRVKESWNYCSISGQAKVRDISGNEFEILPSETIQIVIEGVF